jgi:hypothetical protein
MTSSDFLLFFALCMLRVAPCAPILCSLHPSHATHCSKHIHSLLSTCHTLPPLCSMHATRCDTPTLCYTRATTHEFSHMHSFALCMPRVALPALFALSMPRVAPPALFALCMPRVAPWTPGRPFVTTHPYLFFPRTPLFRPLPKFGASKCSLVASPASPGSL